MKNKFGHLIIFVLSAAALVISVKLFWNKAIYIDENNTTLSAICGGDFWLYMDWLRLFLLAGIFAVSGIKLLK